MCPSAWWCQVLAAHPVRPGHRPHPNYLSQVINEVEGINFYDYVNRLRVEEFKRLLSLPENQRFTLLALAYDCGFNSKSAFNRCFKKTTGLSPSEYAKQLKAVYE